MRYMWVFVSLAFIGCSGGDDADPDLDEAGLLNAVPADEMAPAEPSPADSTKAHITAVAASERAGGFNFSVTVLSPDLGCQQYADWWEVLSQDGELLYRRVLLHSHVGEQPFSRTGGPVNIAADQTVWVRAHMNTSGYGGTAYTGSVQAGFQAAGLDSSFAPEVDGQPPLPTGCDF
ncbi:MAG: hypothetical protein GKR89_02275 [Candidatus Latescibacteria bacterium]|nr:hypothetical protein [Candidatus Latescibacterota bacterium]